MRFIEIYQRLSSAKLHIFTKNKFKFVQEKGEIVYIEETDIHTKQNTVSNTSVKFLISDLYDIYFYPNIKENAKNMIANLELFFGYEFEKRKEAVEIYNKNYEIAKIKIENFLESTDFLFKEQPEETINIMLPNHNDLEKLSKDLVQLNKALKLISINPYIDHKFEINEFHNGSFWLEMIGTSVAAGFLSKVILTTLQIVEKGLSVIKMIKEMKEAGLDSKAIDLVKESAEKKSQLDLEDQIIKICYEYGFDKNDHESIKRVIQGIKIFISLQKKGLLIEGPITAFDKVEFDPESRSLINNLKKLEDSKKALSAKPKNKKVKVNQEEDP